MAPITGMMRSDTIELTIAPKAAPMITPTARSTTLPFSANFLNSSIMNVRPALVDDSRMNHCLVDDFARRLSHRHQGRAHLFINAAQQLEAMLGACNAWLHENCIMQRHEPILNPERRCIV